LPDHLGVKAQLGLDADLETIGCPHQQEVKAAGLGIGHPALGKRRYEGSAKVGLSGECRAHAARLSVLMY
jgi:hypothetical protein